METKGLRKLELLAPARDAETAIAAIRCGADAVYIGGPHHGARASAANSIADIARVVDFAHRFRVRVYVTLNTLIYDNETEAVVQAVRDLYAVGVDALIVQDMGLLRLPIPPIALHASTQCDARTPERARFLQEVGMSCVVLPREASLDEIRAFRSAVDVTLEAFVHGALCVSYSGDCRASLVNGGRSANRGECAQICRLPYNLTDARGNVLIAGRHFLSLRDLNRVGRLAEMADAGVSSFKIEGRLKNPDYVMNVVAVYSRALDAVCRANPDKYQRASVGRSEPGFAPDLNKVFNRTFTAYALDGTSAIKPGSLAAMRTPKWVGEPVGKVGKTTGARRFVFDGDVSLHNGDGLGYFDGSGNYTGFRVNRVDGNVVHTAAEVAVRSGMQLFRNSDKNFDDAVSAARPERRIAVSMHLRAYPGGVALAIDDERGCRAEGAMDCDLVAARTPQQAARRRVLEKLGDTDYVLNGIEDHAGDVFIPASQLAALRRRTVADLDAVAAATYASELRRVENPDVRWPETGPLTFHNNVANAQAQRFYADHGAVVGETALECADAKALAARPVTVMTSRYCLRRELGCCLRKDNAGKLPSPLFLRHPSGKVRTLRLDFDCVNCCMNVVALPAD